MLDHHRTFDDFLILSCQANGTPLMCLSKGAAAQNPEAVIDAIARAYAHEHATGHRDVDGLCNLVTDNSARV